jgi:hypothetical protein
MIHRRECNECQNIVAERDAALLEIQASPCAQSRVPRMRAVTEFTEFAKVMAFVCDQCGAGVDVEGEPNPDA